MRGPGGWWRGKTTPAKVETYTRWSFHSFAVLEAAAVWLAVLGQVGGVLAVLLLVPAGVHSALCAVTASRALDWTRGRRPQPVRLLGLLSAVTAVVAVGALAVAERGPEGEGVDTAAGTLYGLTLTFGAGFVSLGVRDRRRVYALVAGFAAGSALVAFPMGLPAPAAFATAFAVLLGAGGLAFTAVFSVWLLNAVYELDAARETRARLAVAEERLRFGRDLHDVMGRNLAVIALKSELAVQLARRGRAEAVEQMIEVQRIARESQREVRDVVRGYREADLGVELAGAHGVLTATGIRCEVIGVDAADGQTVGGQTAGGRAADGPVAGGRAAGLRREVTGGGASGLPAEVQSALGWVVRETTTNVLRHGDAEWCTVAVRVREERVVLTVENDGARVSGETPETSGGGLGRASGEASGRASGGIPGGVPGGVPGGFSSPASGKAAAVSGGASRGTSRGASRASRGAFGGSGGSGLAGLRERLAAVNGTLEAGFAEGGVFRVVAEVPLLAGAGHAGAEHAGVAGPAGVLGSAGAGSSAVGAAYMSGAAGAGRVAGAEEVGS
ncbi:sensor histidine kinase [Streptomyces sp. NPDC003011]